MPESLYDGMGPAQLADRFNLPRVVVLDHTTSTMDEAHALAADGAAAGTLVLANVQSHGRGRSGARWIGVAGSSILCTLIERPPVARVLDVLSLRVGLGIAAALGEFTGQPIGVKWPNDLLVDGGKCAGILIETRWRDGRPDWVAIAAGVNVGEAPGEINGARGLRSQKSRVEALDAILPVMRYAATLHGPLTDAEITAWSSRDRLSGRRVRSPVVGVARGILPTGELQIETPGAMVALRSGSILLEEE
jgi:BirA family biotin operon repressor/biotin-[acetyl-CoA-carboxylase] ligase